MLSVGDVPIWKDSSPHEFTAQSSGFIIEVENGKVINQILEKLSFLDSRCVQNLLQDDLRNHSFKFQEPSRPEFPGQPLPIRGSFVVIGARDRSI